MLSSLSAALLIGLSSSAHCIFMCGGIAASFGADRSNASSPFWLVNGCFHFGRLLSYATIGCLLGLLVNSVSELLNIGMFLRIVAGILLILMGLYLANIWRLLAGFEQVMQPVWQPIATFIKPYIPASNPRDALIVGLCWGWLPCGLVYSTLVWASSSASNPIESGMLMFAMGVGSLPALLGIGFFSQFLRKKWTGFLSGVAVCMFGLWTLAMPMMTIFGGNSMHSDHGVQQHEGMEQHD